MEMIEISSISSYLRSLHVFNHCETTRRDELMNEPILESRIVVPSDDN